MADTITNNRLFTAPEVGQSDSTWGDKLNANWTRADRILGDTTSKSTSGGDTTLTDDEQDVAVISVSGTLASNANIIFDGRRGVWLVRNNTSGNFSVTFKASGQTGVTVEQGSYAVIYSNGTDILKALETTDTSQLVDKSTWASDAEVSVASASTCDVLGAASLFVAVTGTTTITSFGTGTNRLRIVRFVSTPQVNHNGTSLIIPGGANLTAAAGDVWIIKSDGSSNVRVVAIEKANGKPVVTSFTVSDLAASAVVTEAEGIASNDNDTTLPTSAAVKDYTTGQQTIWIPAAALTPRTTNGAAPGTLEATTNDVMASYLAFDSSTSEGAQIAIQMPKGWNEGTIVAQFVWTHPATTTNFGVVWGVRGVALANDDNLDTAFGTAQEVSDTGGTTNDVYITSETAAVTVAGSPGAEEYVVFEVYRDPADGSDTLAVDAYLLGVKLHYTTDSPKDD